MERGIWIAVEITNAVIEVILAFMYIKAFSKKEIKWMSKKTAAVFCSIVALKFAVSYFIHDNMTVITLTTLLSIAFISLVCFNVRTYWLLIDVLLFVAIASCSELLVSLIITSPQDVSIGVVSEFNIYRFQGLISINLLLLFFIKILEQIRSDRLNRFDAHIWIPLCLLPLFSVVIVMQIISDVIVKNNSQLILLVFSIVGLIFVNIIIFALVEMLIRRGKKDALFAALEQVNSMQKSQIALLADNQARIRELSHDFKQHIQNLSALAETNQIEELIKYMRSLSQAPDRISPVVVTGNSVFDALVSNKKREAEKNGIKCVWKIAIHKQLEILSIDICAFLGNALDNAIEACMRSSANRYINFKIETNEKRLLVIIRNSVGQKPKRADDSLVSLKEDPSIHGIGLKSMKRSCDLLGGKMIFEYDDNDFELRATFPLTDTHR